MNTFGSNNQSQPTNNTQQNGIFGPFNNAAPVSSQLAFGNTGSNSLFGTNSPNMFNNTGTVATQPGGNNVFGNPNNNSLLNNQNSLNSTNTTHSFLNQNPSTTSTNNIFGNQSTGSFLSSQTNSIKSSSGFNFNNNTQNNFNLNSTSTSANLLTSSSNSLPALGSITNISGFPSSNTTNTFFPNQNTLTNSSSMLNNANTLQPKLNFGNSVNPTTNTFSFGGTQTQASNSGIGFGSIQVTSSFSLQSSNPSITSAAPLMNNFQNTSTSFSSIQNSFVPQVTTVNQSSSNNPSGFTLGSTISTPMTSLTAAKPATASPFNLNSNLAVSSGISQPSFTTTNTGLGGISNIKPSPNNASPLAVSSISAKKGLGGSPISDLSKSVLSKDPSQKISVIKQAKDMELPVELKETVETFKKFVVEQKKMREEIVKSNDSSSLMTRVEEESQMLRQSISEVANGLQKVQIQSNKMKCDIAKEQSSIKIVQSVSESSINMPMDHNESSKYFTNKVRDLENRASLYLQEIETVESMCSSTNKSALTSRDLVDIIRKMDDEFIGLAAKLYMVHERVKSAKTEYLRRLRQQNKHQNPFLGIEGRFGDTQSSTGGTAGGSINNSYRVGNSVAPNSVALSAGNDCIGSSPFDTSCTVNLSSGAKSFPAPPQIAPLTKPSIFGANTNNNNSNQTALVSAGSQSQPFSFTGTTPSFGLNKPTSLFMTETEVSNKKRR